jgi:peptidoglycan/xylan/chitin deacetylase (PgdA/CDA1 family)
MHQWILIFLIVVFFCYSILPNLLTRLFSLGVVRRTTTPGTVALTFDDGPDEKYTFRLLDALGEANIKATFFVIGEKALKYPAIIRRMIAEGHEIQVHGYTHSFVPLLLPLSSTRNFHLTRKMLLKEFGVRTTFYRPTWGLCNAAVLLDALQKQYRLVTWSVMVGDWRKTSSENLLSRIEQRLHPGAIIVLHDSDETLGAEPGTPDSVIDLIPHLATRVQSQGYTFEVLSQCARQD